MKCKFCDKELSLLEIDTISKHHFSITCITHRYRAYEMTDWEKWSIDRSLRMADGYHEDDSLKRRRKLMILL